MVQKAQGEVESAAVTTQCGQGAGPEAGALPHKAMAAAQQVAVEGHSVGPRGRWALSLASSFRSAALPCKSSGLCTTSTLVPRGSAPSLRSLALS